MGAHNFNKKAQQLENGFFKEQKEPFIEYVAILKQLLQNTEDKGNDDLKTNTKILCYTLTYDACIKHLDEKIEHIQESMGLEAKESNALFELLTAKGNAILTALYEEESLRHAPLFSTLETYLKNTPQLVENSLNKEDKPNIKQQRTPKF